MGFREKLLRRSVIWKSEVEVRVGKLKNGKASGKVEITGLIYWRVLRGLWSMRYNIAVEREI